MISPCATASPRRGSARPLAVSLAATLDRLVPYLPPGLVTPQAFERVRNVAHRLPAALASWLYLECRLDAAATPTDIIVNIEPAGRDIITGDHPVLALDAALLRDVTWQRTADLAKEWRDDSSLLAGAIESLWLEFDVDAGPPRPSVFVDLTEPAFRDRPAADRAKMIERAIETLRGRAPTRAMRCAIRRCVDSLPGSAVIPYIGIMGARVDDGDTARICVHGLAAAEVLPYLRAVGWAGDHHDAGDVLERLGDTVPPGSARRAPATMHLDIGEAPMARIGFEYTFDRRSQVRGVLTEQELLARLNALSLLTAVKARALALWGGCTTGVHDHEMWESVTARWVNHVKIVCGGGSRLAKAYLSAHDRPRAELSRHRRDATRAGRGDAE